jgi:peptidoglycan/LPS O-acetylase OafA/YrhL
LERRVEGALVSFLPMDSRNQPLNQRFAGARIQSLESMRALAAIQVILLHLFTAFVPPLVNGVPGDAGAFIRNSPLFYLYDGYSAVYVFFVLSGYVLTRPFARDADHPLAVIGARWVRLAVPVVAACAFAAAVMAIWPDAHVDVGHMTGSGWLADLWMPPGGLVQFLRDSFVNALFVGYHGAGTVSALGLDGAALQPISFAYAAPLWTLSIEFFGSIMILCLAATQRFIPRAWPFVVLAAALFLWRTSFVCFIVGHYAAVAGASAKKPTRFPAALCVAGLVSGVFLCVSAEQQAATPLADMICRLPATWMVPCDDAYHFQKTLGALLVFMSVSQWDAARRLLSHRRLALLGRLSFPIYLVHWPIVFGFGCAVYLAALPQGVTVAAAEAVITGLVATLLVALAFTRVDAAAQRLSHVLRDLGRGEAGRLGLRSGSKPSDLGS